MQIFADVEISDMIECLEQAGYTVTGDEAMKPAPTDPGELREGASEWLRLNHDVLVDYLYVNHCPEHIVAQLDAWLRNPNVVTLTEAMAS